MSRPFSLFRVTAHHGNTRQIVVVRYEDVRHMESSPARQDQSP
jgi:hypothetical protein